MTGDPSTAEHLYLDLLKGCLTRAVFQQPEYRAVDPLPRSPSRRHRALRLLQRLVARYGGGMHLVRVQPFDPDKRRVGGDWPYSAETMIGLARLDNLQRCIESVLRDHIPGDLIETGVWRGGATIFMRGVLKAYGVTDRIVWVADSFAGLPSPSPDYPADKNDPHWSFTELAISFDEVVANFAKYGLADGQVRFLKGWFRDTLPSAPIERLAVLRLDGDMYESTMEALTALYPKLSAGGYLIIDDYGAVPGCRQAVEDYRQKNGIVEPIEQIDWAGACWRRRRE